MVKSNEKPVLAEPVQPLLVKTIVSVKATVPLLQYGNIEMFISQEFYTHSDEQNQAVRDLLIDRKLTNLREHLALQVLPLVEAEVERAQLNPEFVKANNKDGWMQRNNPTYRWLRIAAPDMTISAMQDILGNMNIALD